MGGLSVASGLYRPIETISTTTGLASERMVLQACWNRMKRDAALRAEGQPAVVFGYVDPAGATVETVAGTDQLTELYRRLLARDPLQAEVDALLGLHAAVLAEGGINADWLLLSCFAIGSTTKALTC